MTELSIPKNLDECEVYYRDRPVGRLALQRSGVCIFQYDQNYLKEGVSISPIHLPLETTLFEAPHNLFEGNFGVFDDSLPDGWGNLVLDKYLRNRGINPEALNPLQRLSLVGATARGALEYRPDASIRGKLRTIDLSQLAQQVQALYASKEYDDEGIETIFRYSGSAGGGRPKVFVRIDGEEWLVKFAASIDPKDVGVQEYEYSLLARQCGLEMAETRLFEGQYFGTKRFDRSQEGRVHTISAAGLLHADYRFPSLDYLSLFIACRAITQDIREVEKLFRLMVFNVCIGNRDDHAKNFSFQLIEQDWKLSPVYDILPCYGFNGEHTTTIQGQGNPQRSDLLACGRGAGLDERRMNDTIDEVLDICASKKMQRKDLRLR